MFHYPDRKARLVTTFMTEKELPTGHIILAVAPHSDDLAFDTTMLQQLNEKSRNNKVYLMVVAPGSRGVSGKGTDAEKTAIRKDEFIAWAKSLGFNEDQLIHFNAKESYKADGIANADQKRMNKLFEDLGPTMVFMPPKEERHQQTNINVRTMATKSAIRLMRLNKEGGKPPEILVARYPTNHLPIVPENNIRVVWSDPGMPEAKHKANMLHESQGMQRKLTSRVVEEFDSLQTYDDMRQALLKDRDEISRSLLDRKKSGVAGGRVMRGDISPITMRSEHMEATHWRLTKRGGRTAIIVKHIMPLSAHKGLWHR